MARPGGNWLRPVCQAAPSSHWLANLSIVARMKRAHLILLSYALLVAYVSLRPGGAGVIEPWDKLGHLVTYALFALLAFPASGRGWRYVALCVAILAYSGLLEIGQSFMPGRVMSALDLLANLAGILVGALASVVLRRGT